MRQLTLWLLLSIAVTVLPAWGAGPCPEVASFLGEIIIGNAVPGTVTLSWTAVQDGTVREYRVTRQSTSCSEQACSRRVATMRASAQLGVTQYEVADTTGPGSWRYRLTVVHADGRACSMDSGDLRVVDPPACDTGALCAQVQSSFMGEIIIGNFAPREVLRWLTHAETGSVSGYRLSRSNCHNPHTCTTELATIDATGTCGTVQLHRITDEAPAGTWTYRLEVLDATERTACSFDLRLPGPATPSSSH